MWWEEERVDMRVENVRGRSGTQTTKFEGIRNLEFSHVVLDELSHYPFQSSLDCDYRTRDLSLFQLPNYTIFMAL